MLEALGINVEKIQNETDKITGKKKKKAHKTSPKSKPLKQEISQLDANQAINFFEALNDNSKKQVQEEKEEETPFGAQSIQETVSKNINWNQGIEGVVKRNLLIGNIEDAAEVALKGGRHAEALLLALMAEDPSVFD